MWSFRTAIMVAALAALATIPLAGTAAPTPVPGGANETGGVNGTLGGVVFNGKLRLKKMSLALPMPADRAGNLETLVFHALVANGTPEHTFGYFNAALADADGVTVTGRPLDDGWDLQPGAAARTAYAFAVPAGFVPVRLVLIEVAVRHPKAFRIAIRPQDLPAAAAPSPAAT